MARSVNFHGAVVPLVTPVTASGVLDEPALDRLIDQQLKGGVDGIFVLGTTGEGPSVPRSFRRRLVERAVKITRCSRRREDKDGNEPGEVRLVTSAPTTSEASVAADVRRRSQLSNSTVRLVTSAATRPLVYAGIGDTCLADSIAAANEFFKAGVDAVVAHPPVYFPLQPQELLSWFQALLDAVDGPVLIYNIPATTRVSIPLGVVAELVGHPRLAGMKDSDNDAKRHEELLRRFGSQSGFSIFVGVGALMLLGLKLGANGIVPSAGNLIPDVCQQLCDAARRGDWAAAESLAERMNAVAQLYQKGRTLGQSLAALKAALHHRDICAPHMLPPLLPLSAPELEAVRIDMKQLRLLE